VAGRALLLAAIPIALAAAASHADGMLVQGGRYAGGDVTTLLVSRDQLARWPAERWVPLTDDQKESLRADTGVGPSKVFLYDAREGETDCTCHAWNVAFLFRDNAFDVPHRFVVTDQEAAELQADFDASMR
jgi:hypothetical protein